MKSFKVSKLSLLKIFILGTCLLFIFSNFNTKLSILNLSKVIEAFNGDFYSDLSESEVSEYLFLYDSMESKSDIDEVIYILENKRSIPIKMLNIKNISKPQIRLLSKFNKQYSESLGYVYFHNNVITILNKTALSNVSSINENEKFTELVSHEYTHFLINSKLKENKLFPKTIPLWFNEGIAEYVGISSRNGYIPERLETTIKLSNINEIFNDDPDLFYNQSVVFINYLVKNYGYDSIGSILDTLKKNNFEEAIKIVTGETINDISNKLFNLDY
ncbi:peptidase MA family metallohydrolase [Clostridium sp.]|uniref:peptidase MA family metallohydrolase n=1 Tax=Clostridium sp. TaxID=1506 RepID=UPI00399455CC